jgi:hypothetical protein
MPDAIEEKIAVPDETLIGETRLEKSWASIRGNVRPATIAAPEYNAGTPQALK